MDEIKVSIICLCYNHEKYIRKCLEAFVTQKTTFKFEVIVHDDASIDKSAQIIKEFEENYPDIIKPIYQKENQYSKKMRIIQSFIQPMIKGKYIASCEGDDYWTDENKLQKQVEFLESHPQYSVCVHNTRFVNLSEKKEQDAFESVEKDLTINDILKTDKLPFHTSSILYKQELLFNRPEWVYAVPNVGDYPLAIYYALSGKIHYIPDVMSVYNCGTEGSWSNRVSRYRDKRVQVKENMIKMLNIADEYYKYEFTKIFQSRILALEYDLANEKNDLKVILDRKYKKLYQKESLKRKFIIRIKFYFPWLLMIKESVEKRLWK